jgi:hypothetical protein
MGRKKWVVGSGLGVVRTRMQPGTAGRDRFAPSLPTTDYRLPTRPPRGRPGISLLEVLISMFVLLFGLMGVAAVFPVGNHFAGKGEQYDRGAALAEQAFADIKARGMLNPQAWMYAEAPSQSQDMATVDGIHRMIVPTGPNAGSFNVRQHAGTNSSGPGHVFVLDPMGVAAARVVTTSKRGADVFPFSLFSSQNSTGFNDDGRGNEIATNTVNPPAWRTAPLDGKRWPVRRITVPGSDIASPTMTPAVAEQLCRLRDDLANDTPDQDDHPGMQRWAMQVVGAPDKPDDGVADDDLPLARSYAGSYSWLATIVPTSSNNSATVSDALQALQPNDSEYGNHRYEVSVAVFHKRVAEPTAASERCIAASLNIGGELVIHAEDSDDGAAAVDNAVKDLFPGQWIAVAGVHPTTGQFLLKWYKLQSLDDETVRDQISTGVTGFVRLRRAMLEGPDWPAPVVAPFETVQNLRAIILPGVISVVTHPMTMESQ